MQRTYSVNLIDCQTCDWLAQSLRVQLWVVLLTECSATSQQSRRVAGTSSTRKGYCYWSAFLARSPWNLRFLSFHRRLGANDVCSVLVILRYVCDMQGHIGLDTMCTAAVIRFIVCEWQRERLINKRYSSSPSSSLCEQKRQLQLMLKRYIEGKITKKRVHSHTYVDRCVYKDEYVNATQKLVSIQ